jgi:hypothetical protein
MQVVAEGRTQRCVNERLSLQAVVEIMKLDTVGVLGNVRHKKPRLEQARSMEGV